jgi:hypothetical protein
MEPVYSRDEGRLPRPARGAVRQGSRASVEPLPLARDDSRAIEREETDRGRVGNPSGGYELYI